jgi:alkylated DNA repair dioxygenase AlkB
LGKKTAHPNSLSLFLSLSLSVVNEYEPGQGIAKHIDKAELFESPIVSLSLGSDIVMEMSMPYE